MRKAHGQPLILWLMLVETKSLKSLIEHGTGLGQPKTQSLGLLRQRWLSPAPLPGCRGAKVGSLADMGCTHILTGGLSTQHCPSFVSDGSPSSPSGSALPGAGLHDLSRWLGCRDHPGHVRGEDGEVLPGRLLRALGLYPGHHRHPQRPYPFLPGLCSRQPAERPAARGAQDREQR